ncbi:MAG: hypothetical protein R3281_01145 [Balneolaceae bacterium]|nr:hypothetical protein [Balneolaceae bacterium]
MEIYTIIIIFCAVLLAVIISAMIINDKFRADILAGEGEAKIFGLISVRGVVLVLLFALLLGTIVYSADKQTTNRSVSPDILPVLTQAQNASLGQAEQKYNEAKNSLSAFMHKEWIPQLSTNVVSTSGILLILEEEGQESSRQALQEFSRSLSSEVLQKHRELREAVDQTHSVTARQIRKYYYDVSIAAASGDMAKYREMISTPPPVLKNMDTLYSELSGNYRSDNLQSLIDDMNSFILRFQ